MKNSKNQNNTTTMGRSYPGPWRDVHHRGSGGRRLQRAACLCTSWGKLMKGTSWWFAELWHFLYTDTDIQDYTSNYISLYISTITSSHECTYHSTYLQLQVVMHVRTHIIYIYRHTYNTHTYMRCHAITLHCIALHLIYITLHYITLHYIALHYTTSHYIALHCIHINICAD